MQFLQALLIASTVSGQADVQLLEFTAQGCGACQQMAPVVAQLSRAGYRVRQVDVGQNGSLADRFAVRALPTFVVLAGGREVSRHEGAISGQQLQAVLDQAVGQTAGQPSVPGPASPPGQASGQWSDQAAGQAAGQALGQVPRLDRRQLDRRQLAPTRLSGPPSPAPTLPPPALSTRGPAPSNPVQQPEANRRSWADQQPQANQQPPANYSSDAVAPQARAAQAALAASVRLRIEDQQGMSYGSGTIVDTHGDEALVLTCGHIFRESGGDGRILVDLANDQGHDLPGRLISYDLTSDVGLISFRHDRTIQAVQVCGSTEGIEPGDAVFSIGCDRGSAPSIRYSRVTALNKYLGPANITVAGQPIDGRSGGGLFNARGQLIGICNAADPQDDEGLYAALPSIHSELDRANLSFVYSRPASGSVEPPSPALAVQPAESIDVPSRTEIVCIVRSPDDPQRRSRVLVLDQPSPELLDRLESEYRRQARDTAWRSGGP